MAGRSPKTSGTHLSGRTILLTRPNTPETSQLICRLEQHGATVTHLPLIEIQATNFQPPHEWHTWDWLLFTSQQAVSPFFSHPNVQSNVNRFPKIAAVGSKTAQAIQTAGHQAAVIPERFNGVTALQELIARHPQPGQRILWPCGNLANPQLSDIAKATGMQLTPLVVYRTRLKTKEDPMIRQWLDQEISSDWVILTSPSAVEVFATLPKVNQPLIACLGPSTASRAQELIGQVDLVADPPTLDALSVQIVQYYQ